MLLGLDLGSRQAKLVLGPRQAGWQPGEPLPELSFHRYDTILFYRQYGRKVAEDLAVDFAALDLPQFEAIVSTGYGRNTVKIAGGKTIPELKAHMLGAMAQTGLQDFTLLDLGGQDSKVIAVSRGKMRDFVTNDKCAASSGRYLENMAAVLGISLEELSQYADNPVELSSTCAVFGESELIGRIVEGYSVAELAAGVNYTIFRRVQPMLKPLLGKGPLVFTGGVAFNRALVTILERELGVEVVIPPEPQMNGAIGCWVEAQLQTEKEVN
ncbi:acyl-CoA dehydratase activase [Carboxydocella sp. ULO1]|uniref:acyl-CoA dehydratase activase n=1 Tax=Carboxydocella sp. ULO1 TaxID=1926599 RepID=UPI0009AD81A3|nr:acyl-CoA dehydratase activase [Carboxydocella sp. ULO1]GAW28643.1 2-hydroxyglutaryl-CoA dehydratase [Carboxydocella sp. ULO1]